MITSRPDIDLSVVIPTHLPRGLEHTLAGLSRQSGPNIEVIIVENGARSGTVSAAYHRWRTRLDLRYVFDPQPGLNRARNTGARRAGGRFVALLDDDCRPAEAWVESILANRRRLERAAAMGGPVTLEFESRPPGWLTGEFRTCLSELDRGGATRELDNGEFLFGANLVFSRSVFERTGGFAEDIGMSTREPPQMANDEIVFLEEAMQASGAGQIYCPEMGVVHYIPTSRLSPERLFQRRFGQGLSDVALMRRRHGTESTKTLLRYIQSMFPHPWHYQQFSNNLQRLDPESGARYLRHHVVCRTGYLLGYRRAMSDPTTAGSVDRPGVPRAALEAGEYEQRMRRNVQTCAREASMDVDAYMAALMYRRGVDASAENGLELADEKLYQLTTMARLLAPEIFKYRFVEYEASVGREGICSENDRPVA